MRSSLLFLILATNCISMEDSTKTLRVDTLLQFAHKQAQVISLLTAYVNGRLEAKQDGTLLYPWYNTNVILQDTLKNASTIFQDAIMINDGIYDRYRTSSICRTPSSQSLNLKCAMDAYGKFISCSDQPTEEIKNNRLKLSNSFLAAQNCTEAELPKIAADINEANKKPLGFAFDLNH